MQMQMIIEQIDNGWLGTFNYVVNISVRTEGYLERPMKTKLFFKTFTEFVEYVREKKFVTD